MAGVESVVFGLFTFVVCVLLVTNAWAVVDAKLAVAAAAREATRAYVEAPAGSDPAALADAAARQSVGDTGRDPQRLVVTLLQGTFTRCSRVRFEASYEVAALRLPWIGGYGRGFTARARHGEVVDPFRTGVALGQEPCAAG